MLKRIAKKANMEMSAVDQDAVTRYFKLLNTTYMGIRKLHTDQLGVANLDSGIEAGSILTLLDGSSLIVSTLTTDYYEGEAIRLVIDLVETNNTLTIIRPTPILSPQGGVIGKNDVEIAALVPVKVGTILQTKDKTNDSTTSQFGMLLSTKYQIAFGDILQFSSHYADAKIEGIKLNFEGVYEVAFDKDPRWT